MIGISQALPWIKAINMTDGNQDDAAQQLNENKETDGKPVQEDNSKQQTEDSGLQHASGNKLFIRHFRVS